MMAPAETCEFCLESGETPDGWVCWLHRCYVEPFERCDDFQVTP